MSSKIIKKIPEGYKPTEIGVIPEDWKVKRLDKIFSITAGRDLIKESYSQIRDNEHPFPIYSNSLENKGLYGYTGIARYKKNSITITARGTIGRSNARDHEFDAIGRLLVLLPKEKLNCIFISEYLNNKVSFSIESTGVPQLTAPQASKYFVSYPNSEEQTAIATVLSDNDALIEHLEKLIVKKKAIKQGAMQQLLTGKKRLPGFSGEWEVKKLGDIAQVLTGNTPPTNDKSNYGEDYFFVSPADLGKSKYIHNTEKKLSKKGFNISRKFPPNSILFTCIGSTIGKLGIAPIELTSNQQINAVLPNEKFSPDFLFYSLDYISPRIQSLAGEQAVPLVNKTEFERTLIVLPTIKSEQTAIATVLSEIDTEIEKLEKKLDKYRKIKTGMMQQLLTGKIRLGKNNYE